MCVSNYVRIRDAHAGKLRKQGLGGEMVHESILKQCHIESRHNLSSCRPASLASKAWVEAEGACWEVACWAPSPSIGTAKMMVEGRAGSGRGPKV